jgi:hypothetical protein
MTTVTVGTDSYISVADANAYFDKRLNADKWAAASDDNKAKALIMAQIEMSFLRWYGDKSESTQALDWPRSGFSEIEEDEIPQLVKSAQCEFALALLKEDLTNGSADAHISQSSVDGIGSFTYSESRRGVDPFGFAKKVIGNLHDTSIMLMRA